MFLGWVFRVVVCVLLLFVFVRAVVDRLPRLGGWFVCCCLTVVVLGGFLFLWVLGMGCVIL